MFVLNFSKKAPGLYGMALCIPTTPHVTHSGFVLTGLSGITLVSAMAVATATLTNGKKHYGAKIISTLSEGRGHLSPLTLCCYYVVIRF